MSTVTGSVPIATSLANNNPAKRKKQHLHKRSFAVSGDFDFLITELNAQGTVDKNDVKLPLPHPKIKDSSTYGYNSDINRTVPNGIIDLNEALLATPPSKNRHPYVNYSSKPRSFNFHRRSESAPAGLDLLDGFFGSFDATNGNYYNTHSETYKSNKNSFAGLHKANINGNNTNSTIKEEDTEEDTYDKSANNQSLLAPIKPKTLDVKKFSDTNTSSPANTTNISLKKQKERYYNKVKNLPTISSSSTTTYNQNKSQLSLSSSSDNSASISPKILSTTNNTPNSSHSSNSFATSTITNATTKSNSNNNNNNIHKLYSKYNTNAKALRNNNNVFKYQSQMYDIPDSNNIKVPLLRSARSSEDISTRNNNNINSSEEVKDKFYEGEVVLLYGQPGDVVDLSTTTINTPTIKNFESITPVVSSCSTAANSCISNITDDTDNNKIDIPEHKNKSDNKGKNNNTEIKSKSSFFLNKPPMLRSNDSSCNASTNSISNRNSIISLISINNKNRKQKKKKKKKVNCNNNNDNSNNGHSHTSFALIDNDNNRATQDNTNKNKPKGKRNRLSTMLSILFHNNK
ncbi:uncharacterized protein SCDLUD_003818 [Saccharomycodes ludwigii]|uniref:uncharacterized protein n=1 Tax=Saccharomycodes ludwigii TaxID=36035 RepID=UPI001E8B4D10|nr:hypothetical protein SCDLUD_003818 [Saccharomycodes ludwigii]KAH3899541.1 hypothetical protein SCDLUD_003818 [Saccharomycodes ludwigii]